MTDRDAARLSVRARLIFAEDVRPLENYSLLIQGSAIVGLQPHGTCTPDLDLGDVAIIPPLVNAHTHLEFSSLLAPLPFPAGTFASWIEAVVRHRQAVATIDPLASSAIAEGARQSAAHGCLLVGEIATQDEVPADIRHGLVGGIRFRELIGVAADHAREQFARAGKYLAENSQPVAAARVSRDQQPGEGFLPGLSPHAPYSVSWELLQQVVDLSRTAQVPLAMHLAETREELRLMESQDGPLAGLLTRMEIWPPTHLPRGTRPLDYLRALAPAHRTLVIHGNYLAEEELAFMAKHRDRMTLVFCPRTHAYFAHTRWPLQRAHQLGVRVALGTDSRASNPDLSVWREAQFVASHYPEFSLGDLLRTITLFGGEALFGTKRMLAVGSDANFCVVRLQEGAMTGLPATEARDPFRRLFAPASQPTQVWWHGRPVPQKSQAYHDTTIQ